MTSRVSPTTHGFVASMVSNSVTGLAELSLMRSMNTTPGSPGRHADVRSWPTPLRLQPVGYFARVRIDQVVVTIGLLGLHEGLGHRHADVEVGDSAVVLAFDEFEDIGMIDAQDAHVGAAAGSPCFTASVAALKTRRNETGPLARPPLRDTMLSLRRTREKENPVPPPD